MQQMLDALERRLLPQRKLFRLTLVLVVRLRLSRGLPCRRSYSGFARATVVAAVMGWPRPATGEPACGTGRASRLILQLRPTPAELRLQRH